jgi:NAD(P)H-nitrite reductase large subunit
MHALALCARRSLISEEPGSRSFRGEKALVCTCFGVTEETIDEALQISAVQTVEDVTSLCRAGGGCGACTMMIQEMLDNRFDMD